MPESIRFLKLGFQLIKRVYECFANLYLSHYQQQFSEHHTKTTTIGCKNLKIYSFVINVKVGILYKFKMSLILFGE